MIRLLNIKRIGNIIKCDYIPESAEISTPIEYDVQSETFIKFSNPKGYEYCRSFPAKISNNFRNNLDYFLKMPLLCGAKTAKAFCIYIKKA